MRVVEGAEGFDDFVREAGDGEVLAEEVEVEEGADFFLRGGVAQGAAVEPAYEELFGGKKRGQLLLGGFQGGVESGRAIERRGDILRMERRLHPGSRNSWIWRTRFLWSRRCRRRSGSGSRGGARGGPSGCFLRRRRCSLGRR